jgi:hypothetical protein
MVEWWRALRKPLWRLCHAAQRRAVWRDVQAIQQMVAALEIRAARNPDQILYGSDGLPR